MLLTDSCGTVDDNIPPKPAMRLPPPQFITYNAVRYLFFRHGGFVDINSSSPGQIAMCTSPPSRTAWKWDEHGGLFTTEFIKLLVMDDWTLHYALGNDPAVRSESIEWDKFAETLKSNTQTSFKRLKSAADNNQAFWEGGKDQQPRTKFTGLIKPGQPLGTETNYRLGFRYASGQGGAVIRRVYRGTNAEWLGLQPGDTITSVHRTNSWFWNDVIPTWNPPFPVGGGADKLGPKYAFPVRSEQDFTNLMWRDMDPSEPGDQYTIWQGFWNFEVRRPNGQTESIPALIAQKVTQ